MTKIRKNTFPILIDIKYKYSINRFEEEYGDNVSYSEIEQHSYLDLKSMVFEKINENIKFRKFKRENGTLTLKVDMLQSEFEKLNQLKEEDSFDFVHDFIISRIKIYTEEDEQ